MIDLFKWNDFHGGLLKMLAGLVMLFVVLATITHALKLWTKSVMCQCENCGAKLLVTDTAVVSVHNHEHGYEMRVCGSCLKGPVNLSLNLFISDKLNCHACGAFIPRWGAKLVRLHSDPREPLKWVCKYCLDIGRKL